MSPFGYLFIVAGVFLLRQVVVGRASEIPGDARDIANALLNGKPEELQEIMARRGTNVTDASGAPVEAGSDFDPLASVTSSVKGSAYVVKVRQLGSSAKGYRLGGVGPDFYDCSGLLWKAAYDLKLYTGGRFTTATFRSIAGSWCSQVDSPNVGDIVLWEGKHMGVCIGSDRMYSARSTEKGIGTSTISGDSGYFGRQPSYWKVK